jgi:alpha-L-fucosidase 2
VRFAREVFANPVDQVIVVRLSSDRRGALSFSANLKTPQKAAITTENDNTLILQGVNGEAEGIQGALKFYAAVRVLATGGHTAAIANNITVTNADSALLIVAAATSFNNYQDTTGEPGTIVSQRLSAASKKGFPELLRAHTTEHQRLFRRLSFRSRLQWRDETADRSTHSQL